LKLNKILVLVLSVFFLASCSSLPCRKCFERFPVGSENIEKPLSSIDTVVYKVGLNLYTMYFSGLLVVKKLSEDHHKLALISETGFKLFDMEIKNGKAEILNVFAELDKDSVKKTFKEDLTLLVLSGFNKNKCKSYGFEKKKDILYMCPEIRDIATFVVVDPDTGIVSKVWKAEDEDEEFVEINYGFEGKEFSKPKFITIIHFNIHLRIELTLVEEGNV